MGVEPFTDWRADAASALEWWRDAGVDLLVDDAPRDWLAPPAVLTPALYAPAQAVTAAMPDEWQAFVTWRAGGHAPESSWRGTHVAAAGPLNARLMVLADCPDAGDGDEGRLLGGAAGRLFDRMLAAIGMTRDEVHVASVCCKRPAAGRMPRDCEDQLHDVARHHVGLVAPERLLLLGNAASRAILGMDVQPARGSLHAFNHKDRITSAVASFHPRFLLEKPAAKAEAWKDLQVLIGATGK
ncbi:DNA polymerase [Sphingomonas gellani]|uniref:DNA polymerase n=1 Tax=Sphingomonas gellani TaxID=1166340 RepID=A0A1H7ZPG9_9SPHN|nr:uracil-DNA glycosylase [Sphingomonas gellani]SEM59317.1 DNA polymerase [Sphingomonas gellani]